MKLSSNINLLATSALLGIFSFPLTAVAGPEGGAVTSGNAAISSSGKTTTINQTSNRAIIRWDKFDLDASEKVRFNQPSTSSITVNRIRDTKPSRIDGHLSANGNIILINPNGLVFGSSAVVDVGGLVATTSDLRDDAEFMNGGAVKFTKPGKADARIINNGTMTVREGGLAGLVAPHTENHGVIQARLGRVVLASGDISTIDFAGDGLIKLEVSDAVLSQSVTNTGTITADGGEILLTAAQARNIVDTLITNTGTLQARTIKTGNKEQRGKISLSSKGLDLNLPRGNGIVFSTGTIDASASVTAGVPDLSGGEITILGDKISIGTLQGDGSFVTAAGDKNGGTIRIGGAYQGKEGLPTSDLLFIGENVILNASSRRSGNGGTIILWSDTNTRFYGDADVSGMNGGFIEVSSKGVLDYRGSVNLAATNGKAGTLLLDPTDIVISSAATNNVTGTSPFAPTVDDGPSVLNIATLQAALASGSVIVQTIATGTQAGNITVDGAITWNSGHTLTLSAHNDIIVNQAITGRNLTLVAGNDVQLNAALSGTGTLTIEQASDAVAMGIGDGAAGTLHLSGADLANITDGWENLVFGKQGATAGMEIRTIMTWNDSVTLRTGTGVIDIANTQDFGANNLTIITDGNLNVGATTVSGTGVLTIRQASAGTTIGVGVSETGDLHLSGAEVIRLTSGWSDIIIGRADGTGAINHGTASWTRNLTVMSGTGIININGNITVGGGRLTLLTDGNLNVTAAQNAGGGTIVIAGQSASTGIGIGTGQTGAISLTDQEITYLGTLRHLVFGRTDGTGAINVAATNWGTGSNSVTLQSGTGIININGAQTLGSRALNIITDANLNIGGTLSGSTTLTIRGASANTGIGIGTGQAGALSLTNGEVTNIANGWVSIVFGSADGTGTINIGAQTWNDITTFQSGTGQIRVNGAQNAQGNAMTFRTDADLYIGASLTGTDRLTIMQQSAGTSIAVGDGQTGTLHLSSTELGFITNSWGTLALGRSDGTGTFNLGEATWLSNTLLTSGSGQMNINGAQILATYNKSLTFQTDSNLAINDTVSTGSTLSYLAFYTSSTSTSMGIGTGQAGTYALNDNEVANILNGWSSISFGSAVPANTADINIGAVTWLDAVTFRTLSGNIRINGAQNYGGNAAIFHTSADIQINAALSGTGQLNFTNYNSVVSMGIGTGQAGDINFSDAELDFIQDGFSLITFGANNMNGAMNVSARTWNDSIRFFSNNGVITFHGDQNFGENNATIGTNANMVLNGDMIGAGIFHYHQQSASFGMGIGTGQLGTLQLSDTDLDRIVDGWSNITFGSIASSMAMNIGARTWLDSVTFRSGAGGININGALGVGANDLTFLSSGAITATHDISGSGLLLIRSHYNDVSIGIGTGQTGGLTLTDAMLDHIADGWSTITFGHLGMTAAAAINIGAYTWRDAVEFIHTNGVITISGAQNMGTNNLTFRTNADIALNGALTGTGTLLIRSHTSGTIGLGDGQAGNLNLTNSELNRITDGWSNIIFGSIETRAAMNVGAYTWRDNLELRTGGNSNAVYINGAQNMGANNLTITTGSNFVVNAALTGTGTLTIKGYDIVSMGFGGTNPSGVIKMTTAKLALITNGWSQLVFGAEDGSGNIGISSATWNDNVTFRSGSGIISVSGAQNAGSNNMTFITGSDISIGANLSGTGILSFQRSTPTLAMGIGDGQAGTILFSNAELARIQNGWSNVSFGTANGIGAINIGTYTWVNPMSFITQGNIVINGVQTSTRSSGTSLVYASTNGAFINNAGASAINPGGGRYLVYSVDEANDTLGGIVRTGIITNTPYDTYTPDMVVETGNQFIYSNVLARILYLTIDNKNKIYGSALPTFTYTYDGGLVGGDTLTDVVLSYTMGTSGISLLDAVGTTSAITGNFNLGLGYTLVLTNGVITVTPATITVTADNASRVYGSSNPSLSVTYSGFKNDEDQSAFTTQATATSTANAASNVGTYGITASGAAASNYIFSYVGGTLTVNKAMLTATATSTSRQYGDANPTFGVTYTGFRNGQNQSVIGTLATASSTADETTNAGTGYAITAGGAFDDNYDFIYAPGVLTITKATLTARADNASREYGDANPGFTVSYTGFKNNEDDSVINTAATGSSTANAYSNVGNYAITTSGASDDNYNFVYQNGTLSVTKATLLATAQDNSRVYGYANPSFSVVYTGFKNGEDESVINTDVNLSTTAGGTANVGTHTINASGGLDNNYTFTYASGTLTITKATLTATANNASRVAGEANPAFTVSYTGFRNGENASVINTLATASSLADGSSPVGTYAITASGASDNNYDFAYVDGVLDVLLEPYVPPVDVPVTSPSLGDIPPSVIREMSTTSPPYYDNKIWGRTSSYGTPGQNNNVVGIAILPEQGGSDYGWQGAKFLIGIEREVADIFQLEGQPVFQVEHLGGDEARP